MSPPERPSLNANARFDRLVHTGNVVIDLALTVPALPPRGGDVVARSSDWRTGGAFNVMAATARLGLATLYAGAHGRGPRGDQARRDLTAEGVSVFLAPEPDVDTGFVVCLVEEGGERTFVTSPGAETRLRPADLAGLSVRERDAVYVSGYSLARPATRAVLEPWVEALPAATTVIVDPGPLGAELAAQALRRVLARADWVSANAAEAGRLTGSPELLSAAHELAALAPRAGIVVRADRRGAVLLEAGGQPKLVPAVPVPAADVVDTTGAGDAHTGAFLAALADGMAPDEAVRRANAAAAIAITRAGPATGPTRAQLDAAS